MYKYDHLRSLVHRHLLFFNCFATPPTVGKPYMKTSPSRQLRDHRVTESQKYIEPLRLSHSCKRENSRRMVGLMKDEHFRPGWNTLQKWNKSFHSMILPAILPKDTSQCVGKLISVPTGLLMVFARFQHAFQGVSLLVLEPKLLIAALKISYFSFGKV